MPYPIAAVRGGHTPQSAAATSLLLGLEAYWPLNEASGDRADLGPHGYTLSQVAPNPGSNTGLVYPLAAEFTRASDTDGLTSAAAGLKSFFNAGDFSVAAWVYAYTDVPAAPIYAYAVGNASGTWDGGFFLFASGIGLGQSVLFLNDGAGHSIVSHGGVAQALNGWHLFRAWYDRVANEVHSDIDFIAEDTPAYTWGTDVASFDFFIGRDVGPSAGKSWDGRIGPVALWDRKLTAGEWLEFYNGGAGKAYPF